MQKGVVGLTMDLKCGSLEYAITTGSPSESEWESILKEDEDFNSNIHEDLQHDYLEDEL